MRAAGGEQGEKVNAQTYWRKAVGQSEEITSLRAELQHLADENRELLLTQTNQMPSSEVQRLVEENQRLMFMQLNQPGSQEEELAQLKEQLNLLILRNASLQSLIPAPGKTPPKRPVPKMVMVDGKPVVDLTPLRPPDAKPPRERPRSTIFQGHEGVGADPLADDDDDDTCDLTAQRD